MHLLLELISHKPFKQNSIEILTILRCKISNFVWKIKPSRVSSLCTLLLFAWPPSINLTWPCPPPFLKVCTHRKYPQMGSCESLPLCSNSRRWYNLSLVFKPHIALHFSGGLPLSPAEIYRHNTKIWQFRLLNVKKKNYNSNQHELDFIKFGLR